MPKTYLRIAFIFTFLTYGILMTASDCKVDGIYYILSNGEATVTYLYDTANKNANTYSGEINVPSYITYNSKSYKVVAIGDKAFQGCKQLTSIHLPSTLTTIGESAFLSSGLTTISFPNSLTRIGGIAFYGCKQMKSIIIPKSVNFIGNGAFAGCSTLTDVYISDIELWCNITFGNHSSNPLANGCRLYINGIEVSDLQIPNTVNAINDFAFKGCISISSITIPESVKSIGQGAFSGCNKITNIKILGNALLKILSEAFVGCKSLSSVFIPNCVTSIGNYAFQDCTNLTNADIHAAVIGYGAFKGCSQLKDIYIGSNTKQMMLPVFEDCDNISKIEVDCSSIGEKWFSGVAVENVILGDSVKEVSKFAFLDCVRLTSLEIGKSVEVLDKDAFKGCNINKVWFLCDSIGEWSSNYPNLKEARGNGVTIVGNSAFSKCSFLEDIKLNTVKRVGNNAFYGCCSLISMKVPKSLTSIGANAFQGCTSLNKVEVEDLAAWCSIEFSTMSSNPVSIAKHLFLGVGTECYREPSHVLDTLWTFYEEKNIVIPQNVNKILNYTFSNCESIETISFPDSLTSIGNYSFSSCSGLTSVSIPNNVTSIGSNAFSGCSGLTSASIPNSVTSIGNYAFQSCSSLTSVSIPNGVTSIENGTFDGCSNLFSVILNSNAIVSKNRRTWDSKKKVYVYDSFKNIFGNQVEHYEIADSVNRIGNYAFAECTGMTSIKIANSVYSIGEGAFYGCSGLIKVIAPDIAAWCNINFSNDSSNPIFYAHHLFTDEENEITELVIPDGVTSIRNYAFSSCTGLTSISLPNSITSIGNYAFENCSNLKEIIISDNVTDIYNRSFDKSVKLYVNSNTISLLSLWRAGFIPYEIGTDKQLDPPYFTVLSTTQTTATLELKNKYMGYKHYIDYSYTGGTLLNDKELELTNLVPDTEYSKTLTVVLKEGDQTSTYSPSPITFTTQSMEPSLGFSNTATSYSVNGKYTKGSAHVVKEEIAVCYKKRVRPEKINREPKPPFWRDPKSGTYYSGDQYYDYFFQTEGSKSIDGNVRSLYHLEPNTNMTDSCLVYRITIEYDDLSRDSSTAVVIYPHTLPLELTTLQPRVATPGNVIVAAQSNIGDSETNVGFEWRRTDWTDDFPSNTGTAFLYEGTMEGYIRNLNTEKLWKYRPYYTSSSGKTYYGEWMGLDPTNTSYFEPTVHTYAKIQVQGNSAEVKGYAMRGSDNIVEQGFKYWKQQANARGAAGNTVNIPKSAQTVEATGNMMTAELTGLDYESDYCVVAFMKTSENEIFYGEQQTFRTGEDITGIETLTQPAATDNTGIYDLKGHKLTKMQRGMNIIRMSDGTVRKVMVK